MNKICFLFLVFLFGAGTLFSEESEEIPSVHQCYTYHAFGLGFPSFFTLDIGKRIQHNHIGWEVGGGFGTSIVFHEIHLYVSSIYFPFPNSQSEYYLGLNTEARYIFHLDYPNKGRFLFTPKVLLGKEFVTKKSKKRFFQINVGYAHFNSRGLVLVPDISLNYGIQY